MTRSPRVFGLLAALLLSTVPSNADAAAIFRFSGAGDGGIVWDGGGDVGTMQNDCINLPPGQTCTSAPGGEAPVDIVANITFELPVNFEYLSLSLALTIPEASCPSGISCENIVNFKSSHGNLSQQYNDSGPADTSLAVALFAFEPVDVTQALSGTLTLHLLQDEDIARALWPSAMVGFVISFAQNQSLLPEDPRNPGFPDFVSVTVDIPTGAAAVPEPTSMLLLGTGLVGAAARRYRRRNSASQS